MTETTLPGVSIVLPYYNGSAFIRETVESVLAQTYRDYELFIVDDGSSQAEADHLVGLIASLADDRIAYLRKDNGGLSDARNFGIRKANADLICLLDQDDVWEPEKLARQVAAIGSGPGIDVVVTDGVYFGTTDGPMNVSRVTDGKAQLVEGTFAKMLRGNFVIASSIMFRKRVVEAVGESSRRYFVVPDFEYFIRMAEKYEFYVVPEPLVRYRFHGANTTKARFRLCAETVCVLGERTLRTRSEKYHATYRLAETIARIAYNWVKKLWE
jgi:glycosyltransferase involved in cell wall biosynthesis